MREHPQGGRVTHDAPPLLSGSNPALVVQAHLFFGEFLFARGNPHSPGKTKWNRVGENCSV